MHKILWLIIALMITTPVQAQTSEVWVVQDINITRVVKVETDGVGTGAGVGVLGAVALGLGPVGWVAGGLIGAGVDGKEETRTEKTTCVLTAVNPQGYTTKFTYLGEHASKCNLCIVGDKILLTKTNDLYTWNGQVVARTVLNK